jgi:adenylate cyclase
MATEGFRRKLAAIFSADVVGYSRLMGEDEEGTIRTLTEYRDLISGLIATYRGRVVDSPGDNILAEFISVVDAVQCAVKVQEELEVRNSALPEHRRMEIRIGINLGDVVEEENRLYGDGINIAARLESLADAGGICVSGSAYEQIEDKVPYAFDDLGERSVKNIRKPVRVFRVRMGDETVSRAIGEVTLSDKPSIAVLPFDNMSGDPEQEYFSDGITEEIITGLSKVPEMFVIARNSSFTYKGRSVNVGQIGRELGVGYVLQGSVRKEGIRVRITAQLIDTKTGRHLWADRYDREMKDIFAIQDEITTEIMRAMQVTLTEGEQACEWLRRGSGNLEAYEKGMKGMEYFRRFSPEGNIKAREMFEEGIRLDSESPGNYVMLGWTHLLSIMNGWSKTPEKSMEQAAHLAGKSLDLDESLADAHALLGYVYLLKRDYDKAVEESERAVSLNPNYADAHAWLAIVLTSTGKLKEAIGMIKKAMRLNPFPPNWYFLILGDAYFCADRYHEAVAAYHRALEDSPNFLLACLGLTACHSLLGHDKEAAHIAAKVREIDPRFSLDAFERSLSYKEQADKERFVNALSQAGLQ